MSNMINLSAVDGESTIFCCSEAMPFVAIEGTKLYNDPNRDIHQALFRSFITFAVGRQHAFDLKSLIQEVSGAAESKIEPDLSQTGLGVVYKPLFDKKILESLENNPLSPQVPYVIHLTSRHDFGPVVSHRYFVCPIDMEDKWTELSLMQWFAQGAGFSMKAEKWDVKCPVHCKFFRMTLRPNLVMRGCWPIALTASPHEEGHAEQGECGKDHVEDGYGHIRESDIGGDIGGAFIGGGVVGDGHIGDGQIGGSKLGSKVFNNVSEVRGRR